MEFPIAITPPDQSVYEAARNRSDGQAKPIGALGRLEELGAWVAACQGQCPPEQLTNVRAVVFAGDHEVAKSGVSAYPVEVTPAMVYGILAGHAGVSVLAREANVSVRMLDISVAVDLDVPPEVSAYKVRYSARPIHLEDALTVDETRTALAYGDQIAAEEIAAGAQLLIAGDLGIGNTTPAAALIAATYGLTGAEVAGRGTGLDDDGLAHKAALIDQALARVGNRAADPLTRLAALGSADLACAAGFMIGAARRGVPILVDGVIATAEAVLAESLAPGAVAWMQAGHRSPEPGLSAADRLLGLVPMVDLGMRLGEGSGAVLAVPIVRAAVATLRDIAQLADVLPA